MKTLRGERERETYDIPLVTLQAVNAVRFVDVAVDLQKQLHIRRRLIDRLYVHRVSAIAGGDGTTSAAAAAAAAASPADIIRFEEARIGLLIGWQLELPSFFFAP
jgi:hypothetical protein